MNQKITLSLLGLTLAIVATLAIAPIVSGMAYAAGTIDKYIKDCRKSSNFDGDRKINQEIHFELKAEKIIPHGCS
jgi:hypothetical protein